MPLNLDPYVSPLLDHTHVLNLIHDYFSKPGCDYQLECAEGFDWQQQKLEEIIQHVCKTQGIDESKVKVLTCCVYNTNTAIQFTTDQKLFRAMYYFAEKMHNTYVEKQLKFHFLSMVNRPTWDRLSLASFLHANHANTTKIKFPLNKEYMNESLGIDKAFAKYYDTKHYRSQILNFLSQLPIDDVKESWTRQELYNVWVNDSQFNSMDLYKEIAVEAVNETNITRGFFITEKIVRPIAYNTPFVVMATANFLKNIRALGFKTFDSVWDESYDELEGKDRLEKIYQTINNISQINLDYLHKNTHDICVYNKSVLDSYQWKNKIKDIKV